MRSKEEEKEELEIEETEVDSKFSLLKKIIIIIALLITIVFVYIRYIATYGFMLKEYAVYSDKLPSNFNGLKVAHLSDIHYGSIGKDKLNKIVDEVNRAKPDIIVFTGDLYDGYTNLTDDMKQSIIDSLSRMDAPLGKYAVSGNHDYSYDCYQELIVKSGFTYLNSESKIIYYNGIEPIEIVGYPSSISDKPNYNIELSDYFKIGLIHEGDSVLNILNKNFDLILAGHSHGGQIKLPFIGALLLPPEGKKYYDSYYKINNTDLYVSSGLGETKYKIRAFNRPSFNLYRLYSNK